MPGARGKSIVDITHFLVVERFYFIIIKIIKVEINFAANWHKQFYKSNFKLNKSLKKVWYILPFVVSFLAIHPVIISLCHHKGGLQTFESLAYLWSVERGPFHAVPPGHYGRLSSLLDLYVLQSGKLIPLRSTADFRPAWAYLRTLPLLFGKRSPQANYPLFIVPLLNESRLGINYIKGGISRVLLCLIKAPTYPIQ